MGRFKNGQKQRTTDLWQLAGGRDALVRSFIKHNVCDIDASPEQWLSVTLDVFKINREVYVKWLKVICREDRRGLRTEVLLEGGLLLKGN